jgi:5-methylcytosine-specific restriction endonuclease McrA
MAKSKSQKPTNTQRLKRAGNQAALAKCRRDQANRNKARRALGLKPGDPREADHKRPLSKGGSNSKQNLRAVSRTTNRRKGAKSVKSR